ncbi:terminus macrodomain insulation protein YfbV [Pasteurellaceae bacterium LIM206]|nr:terminus macrodomain insulation protein YfbV [Pasteurellaceae bacterium LIM206]
MNVCKTINRGQKYLNAWPLLPKLGMIFPENRIIKTTRFAIRFMPFMAVFSIVWQQFYAKHDMIALAIAVIVALFALCIPLQGLYWLGKRANTLLPPQSAVSFQRILQELARKQIIMPTVEHPTYQHLADALNKAQQYLEPSFWEDI